MDRVRIGVVGSGFMGRTYVDAVTRQCSDAEVVAVTGGRRAPSLAAEYGITFEPSLDDLLARVDIELVIVATPNSLHAQQAIKAIEAGKHVLVENPLALSVMECDQMIEAAEESGVRLFSIKTTRFRQSPLHAKEVIDSGLIGEPRMVSLDMLMTNFNAPAMEDPSSWANDPSEGGSFLSWGGHNFDALRWFLGSEVVLAFGQARNYEVSQPADASGMAMLTFESGVLAQVWMSSELPPPGLPSLARFIIVGSKGIVDCDHLGAVRVGVGERWTTVYEMPPIDWMNNPRDPVRQQAFADEVGAAARAIRGEVSPQLATGYDGREAIRIAIAIEKSAQTGKAVRLDEIAPARL